MHEVTKPSKSLPRRELWRDAWSGSFTAALVGFGSLGHLTWYGPFATMQRCQPFRYTEADDWLLVGEDLDDAVVTFAHDHPEVARRVRSADERS